MTDRLAVIKATVQDGVYTCRHRGKALQGQYPWYWLQDQGEGGTVLVVNCRSGSALRASACIWGKRTGGRIRIRKTGERSYRCTLIRVGEKVESNGRGRYAALRLIKIGEETVIPWGTRRWQAATLDTDPAYQAIYREVARGRRFYTHPTPDGLRVKRVK